MSAPLAGVRVVDLTMFVSGPFASMVLADLGADVIKVEPLTGDPVRHNGMGAVIDEESAQFQSFNRNKRSLAVDLKTADGLALIEDLAAASDVVLDNFRPGVMQRLGLDHATLSARNAGLVSCSISAFGNTGPWRERPGFDLIVQALSGAMSLTGHAASGPAHIPFHIGDTASGMFAAIGVLAALTERSTTGVGREVEIGLLDSLIALASDEVTNQAAGLPAKQHGGGHPELFPYQAFPTMDRPLVIAAVGVDKFWPALCEVVGRPDLAAELSYATNDGRVAVKEYLTEQLTAVLRTKKRAEWLALLQAADVPATPVNDLDALFDHPQVEARSMLVDLARPSGSRVTLTGNPIKTAGHEQTYVASPTLGQDTAPILSEVLGLDDEAIAGLRASGAIGPA
ncbi:MAG: CoA:oxalate CoA-transferase [Acidimicrobiales bacterium]|jgi:CoA:oxalate CoA-transferase